MPCLMVARRDQDHPLLLSNQFAVSDLHWLTAPMHQGLPQAEFDCCVKTRHRQKDLPCRVSMRADGACTVTLQEPARAVTPGQFAVFYSAERCLGGGVIANRAFVPAIPYNERLLREVS